MVNRLVTLTFKRKPHKMVKRTQIVRRQHGNNCLSVFDHYLGLTLNPNLVGFLGVCFEVGKGGGGKTTPCLLEF